MNQKLLIPTVLFIGVLISAFLILPREKNKKSKEIKDQIQLVQDEEVKKNENGIIFFYGDGCPHCKVVEEYLEENKIRDKISFERKEVYYNKNNSEELGEKAQKCGISTDSVGVPFLWTGENCLIGSPDIINFFKTKTNEK